jgi:hypothetical protein
MLFIKIRVYQEVLCKQLIRGLLLFIGLGLLYSLCILFIEYFFGSNPWEEQSCFGYL